MDKIEFVRKTWFTGRNGLFTSKGLEVWEASNNDIVISPITGKGQVGRCDIAIPKENIYDVIRELERYMDDCKLIAWSIEDFEQRATRIEKTDKKYGGPIPVAFDRSKFTEALDAMCSNADALDGTNWETVDAYLFEYCVK